MAGNLDILTSPKGLREGIVLEYIFSQINPNIYQERQNDFKMKSAHMLGNKFSINDNHSLQTEKIAAMLFTELRPLHELDSTSLPILKAAAYLHDIGMIINYKDHHKHSQYIISQAALSGFTQEEKEIIGLVARYHRKSNPKNSHTSYKALSESRQREISQLAAILRIADAMDQSHQKNVDKLSCSISEDKIAIMIEARPGADLTLEKWSVQRKKSFAHSLWNRDIILQEKNKTFNPYAGTND